MHEKPALVCLGCGNYIPKTADERKICIKSLNVYGAIFNEKCESASFGIKKHSETKFSCSFLSSFGMEISITVTVFSEPAICKFPDPL